MRSGRRWRPQPPSPARLGAARAPARAASWRSRGCTGRRRRPPRCRARPRGSVEPARRARAGPRAVPRRRPVAYRAVTGHDGAGREREQPLHRARPVERVAVAEARRGALLEQVAGEQHVRVRHLDRDVRVRVRTPEVGEPQLAVAGLDRRPLLEGPIRRVDHDLADVPGDRRDLAGDLLEPLLAERRSRSTTRAWPQMEAAGRRCCRSVVEMPVGVDDDRDGSRVSSRIASAISRAWTGVERVSMTTTSRPPRITPMLRRRTRTAT